MTCCLSESQRVFSVFRRSVKSGGLRRTCNSPTHGHQHRRRFCFFWALDRVKINRYNNRGACSPTIAPCTHVHRFRTQTPLILPPASLPAGLTPPPTTHTDAEFCPLGTASVRTPLARRHRFWRVPLATLPCAAYTLERTQTHSRACHSQHTNTPPTQNRGHRTSLSTHTARALDNPIPARRRHSRHLLGHLCTRLCLTPHVCKCTRAAHVSRHRIPPITHLRSRF